MQSYSVKATAQLTGLSPHTLRAWERRHSAVDPSRTGSGRRAYSAEQVDHLRRLAELTRAGHSIGALAKLSKREIASMAGSAPRSFGGGRVSAILSAARDLDLEEVDRQILQARLSTPVRSFVLDFASPLLVEVGRLVSREELGIAQEHALSAILRTHLSELMAQTQRIAPWGATPDRSKPRLLFATPEGDLHEFGILLAAILAGSRGFKFRYLGPNLPADALALTALRLSTDVVVLGSVPSRKIAGSPELRDYVREFVKATRRGQGARIQLWIGGSCAFSPQEVGAARFMRVLDSLSEFDRKLASLDGRALAQ